MWSEIVRYFFGHLKRPADLIALAALLLAPWLLRRCFPKLPAIVRKLPRTYLQCAVPAALGGLYYAATMYMIFVGLTLVDYAVLIFGLAGVAFALLVFLLCWRAKPSNNTVNAETDVPRRFGKGH